jgi:hypothetical protein
MKITKEILSDAARHILRVLDEQGVSDMSDMEQFLTHGAGHTFRAQGEDIVRISIQPSNKETTAYVISYVQDALRIPPLEVRINPKLGYMTFFCTCSEKLPGFDAFDQSDDGDYLQDKKMKPVDIDKLREELQHFLE